MKHNGKLKLRPLIDGDWWIEDRPLGRIGGRMNLLVHPNPLL